VAGIAHISSNPKMEDLYYSVNRDLTIETAKKAKLNGVKQFIFMSSIIVYGDSSPFNCKRVIDMNTIPKPSNFYGKSKLQAEEYLLSLMDDYFKVVIVRSPMIYGRGSKGNYSKLSKLARIMPVFPYIQNERSMLYIDNLCELIRLVIDNEDKGIFYPQNEEYVCTSELVKLISEVHGKKIILTKLFNPILITIGKYFNAVNKVFGNLVYEKSMSNYKKNYRVVSLRESIIKTEIG